MAYWIAFLLVPVSGQNVSLTHEIPYSLRIIVIKFAEENHAPKEMVDSSDFPPAPASRGKVLE